jgi:hypothetical protein
MPVETKQTKAHRILTEGRLVIDRVDPGGLVVATCRGMSGEVYTLGWDNRGRGRWGCTCEASREFHRTCSHLTALQLIVARP